VKTALTSFEKIEKGNGTISREMKRERAVCRFFCKRR
jgi:hypothetical protein